MKSARKRPAKRKKPTASTKSSRAEEARQAVAEYIDEQRKVLQKLLRKLYN